MSEELKRCPNKKHSINLGENNGMWKGNNATIDSARERARRLLPLGKGYEIHHIDGNPYNNNLDNLLPVTRKEHMMLDGRFKNLSDSWKRNRFTIDYDKIIQLHNQGLNDNEIAEKLGCKRHKIFSARKYLGLSRSYHTRMMDNKRRDKYGRFIK